MPRRTKTRESGLVVTEVNETELSWEYPSNMLGNVGGSLRYIHGSERSGWEIVGLPHAGPLPDLTTVGTWRLSVAIEKIEATLRREEENRSQIHEAVQSKLENFFDDDRKASNMNREERNDQMAIANRYRPRPRRAIVDICSDFKTETLPGGAVVMPFEIARWRLR